MKSKIAEKILSKTSEEGKQRVREYANNLVKQSKMKYYYLINGKIMSANEKMPEMTNYPTNEFGKNDYNDDKLKWHSSLQPCEISESELENIKLHLAVSKQLCAVRDSPIEVTDIIVNGNKWSNEKQCFIDAIYFKEHPKQVEEIEAVDEMFELFYAENDAKIHEW